MHTANIASSTSTISAATATATVEALIGNNETLNWTATTELVISRNGQDEQDVYIFDRPSVRVIFIVLYTIVFCFCFFGNLMVILVVTLHWRMRNITKFCLANLAFADLCVGVFCVYQNLSIYLSHSWVLGQFLCKMYQFINALSHTAAVLILVVICVERYLAILYPLQCKRLLTIRRLRIIIIGVWLVSAIYCSPRLYYIVTMEVIGMNEDVEIICAAQRNLYDSKTFDMIHFLLLFLTPLLVISILYARVGITLWRSSQDPVQVNWTTKAKTSKMSVQQVNKGKAGNKTNNIPSMGSQQQQQQTTNKTKTRAHKPNGNGKTRKLTAGYQVEDNFTDSSGGETGLSDEDEDDIIVRKRDSIILRSCNPVKLKVKINRRSQPEPEPEPGSFREIKLIQRKEEQNPTPTTQVLSTSSIRSRSRQLDNRKYNQVNLILTSSKSDTLNYHNELLTATAATAATSSHVKLSNSNSLPLPAKINLNSKIRLRRNNCIVKNSTRKKHGHLLKGQHSLKFQFQRRGSSGSGSASHDPGQWPGHDHNRNGREGRDSDNLICESYNNNGKRMLLKFHNHNNSQNQKQAQNLKSRQNVVRMLIVMVVTFALCNFPFHLRKIFTYWWPKYDFGSSFSTLATPLSYLFMYINCAINPLLYAFMSKTFRSSFKDLLTCRWQRDSFHLGTPAASRPRPRPKTTIRTRNRNGTEFGTT